MGEYDGERMSEGAVGGSGLVGVERMSDRGEVEQCGEGVPECVMLQVLVRLADLQETCNLLCLSNNS